MPLNIVNLVLAWKKWGKMAKLDTLLGISSQQNQARVPQENLISVLTGQKQNSPMGAISRADAKALGFPDAPAPYKGIPLLEEMKNKQPNQPLLNQDSVRKSSMTLSQPIQEQISNQSQQGGDNGGGFFSNIKKTLTSKDFGDRLTEGLLGYASGDTVADSFTRAGKAMYEGNMGRREANATISYLKNQGLSDDEAYAAVKNPTVMRDIIAGQAKNISPLDSIKMQTAQLGLDKAKLEYDRLSTPPITDTILTDEQKEQYGLPKNGVFQINKNGKISTIDGGRSSLQDARTSEIKNYEYAVENGFNGSFNDYNAQKRLPSINGTKIDLEALPLVTMDKDGYVNKKEQEEFLKSLPQSLRAMVGSIAEGRTDLSKVTSVRAGERQELARIVNLYDPTFDASQVNAKVASRRDFSSGDMAKVKAASNLAIQHLGNMVKTFTKLKNSNYPAYNTVANAAGKAIGNPELSALEVYKLGVSEELAKAFHGTGAVGEKAVHAWQSAISSSSSPQQMEQAVISALDMLSSRAETYNQRYKDIMGEDAPEFLTETSRELLRGLGFDPAKLDVGQRKDKRQGSNGLQIGQTTDGYEYLGGNPNEKQSWRKVQ